MDEKNANFAFCVNITRKICLYLPVSETPTDRSSTIDIKLKYKEIKLQNDLWRSEKERTKRKIKKETMKTKEIDNEVR